MSQYYRSSIVDAKNDHEALVTAGVCPAEDLRMACMIDKTSSGFVVKRDGVIASQYYRSSAIDAATDMKNLVQAGVCL